jgi:hypothetical protein
MRRRGAFDPPMPLAGIAIFLVAGGTVREPRSELPHYRRHDAQSVGAVLAVPDRTSLPTHYR